MSWIRNRANLIGVGAVVVAVVALGVALADRHHHRQELFRMEAREFGRPMPVMPFGGGPFARRFEGGPMPLRGGPSFAGPETGPEMGALHGEFTVPDAAGKYLTIDVQRGTVSSVSATSLTVRSSDGFTKTYTLTGTVAQGVKKGDAVAIRALVSGGKATVSGISDLRAVRGGTMMVPNGTGMM